MGYALKVFFAAYMDGPENRCISAGVKSVNNRQKATTAKFNGSRLMLENSIEKIQIEKDTILVQAEVLQQSIKETLEVFETSIGIVKKEKKGDRFIWF